jgi:hypothetical protein
MLGAEEEAMSNQRMSHKARLTARPILVLTLVAVLCALTTAGSVLAAPAGHTPETAISLTTNTPMDYRATGAFKGLASSNTACTGVNGHAVWFTWVATDTTTFSASTLGSEYDTFVYVYDSGMNQISCNDDFDFGTPCPATGTANHCSKAVFSATIGETYYIVVGAFASTKGGKGRILVSD